MMAWVRSATWSWLKLLLTWLRTVLGLRTRRLAISTFWCPCAIRSRISRSRSLSSGKTWGTAAGRRAEKKSIRRLAMAGLKSASPLPTARAGLEPPHEQMVAFLGTPCEQHDQLDEWGCGIW